MPFIEFRMVFPQQITIFVLKGKRSWVLKTM